VPRKALEVAPAFMARRLHFPGSLEEMVQVAADFQTAIPGRLV